MAELLMGKGWPEPGSLGATLRDELPDEYVVVADLTVHGQPVDAVVLGPQGVFMLRAKGWQGEIQPTTRGPWRGRLDSGRQVQYPNPADEARQDERALWAFLRDEFPSLRPAVHHLLVLTDAGARVQPGVSDPVAVRQDSVAEAILAEPPGQGALLREDEREALAVALRDRQLTATQRATAPFVFRSGGLLGSGKKAWTVREAVEHIDSHPEDGIFHLRNGTLARWLEEQGAGHLAELAREVMRRREMDPRAVVEAFLIGSGLVKRPRLSVRPRRLSLGCSISGDRCEGRLEVRKGRGRGYLFGTLRTSEPWLRVEPTSLRGGPLKAVVSADTGALPISNTAWQGEVLIDSSASPEPVPVLVRVRVVGMPSALNQFLLRPLVGAIIAGLLGLMVGWVLGRWGLGLPGWIPGVESLALTPEVFWAAAVGVFWALLGGIRGALQPACWPVSHAFVRWLRRTLMWGAVLPLASLAGYWLWLRFGPETATGAEMPSAAAVALGSLALAMVPAVLGEVRWGRRGSGATAERARRPQPRGWALWVALAGAMLALVVLVVLPILGGSREAGQEGGTAPVLSEQVDEGWGKIQAAIEKVREWITLRYYDRRAPRQPTPTASPPLTPGPTQAPAPAPTAGGPSP